MPGRAAHDREWDSHGVPGDGRHGALLLVGVTVCRHVVERGVERASAQRVESHRGVARKHTVSKVIFRGDPIPIVAVEVRSRRDHGQANARERGAGDRELDIRGHTRGHGQDANGVQRHVAVARDSAEGHGMRPRLEGAERERAALAHLPAGKSVHGQPVAIGVPVPPRRRRGHVDVPEARSAHDPDRGDGRSPAGDDDRAGVRALDRAAGELSLDAQDVRAGLEVRDRDLPVRQNEIAQAAIEGDDVAIPVGVDAGGAELDDQVAGTGCGRVVACERHQGGEGQGQHEADSIQGAHGFLR